MLQFNPKSRPSSSECLSHEIFKSKEIKLSFDKLELLTDETEDEDLIDHFK